MANLTRLLYEGNKGYCLEIVNSKQFNNKEVLKKYEKELKERLGDSSNSQWDIAILLAHFVRSGSWSAFHDETMVLYDKWNKEHPGAKCSDNPYGPIGGNWWSDNSIFLLTFLKEKFGICRTTLYNYLEVVDKFATYVNDKGKDPEYKIGVEAKFFQFWQLVEMLPLTYSERTKIQPNWTRAEIRAYKKSLRDKDKPGKIQPAEQIEPEEKPRTEAQQRFSKYSKDDLINEVVRLEEKVKELEESFQKSLTANRKLRKDRPNTVMKKVVSAEVEGFLKQYSYEILLHGKKQGAKPFAGNIVNLLFDKFSNLTGSTSSEGDIIYVQEQLPV